MPGYKDDGRRNWGRTASKAIGLMMAGAALVGCNTAEARPVETTSQLPPDAEAPTNSPESEQWKDMRATVDKYPDVVSAATYLMGGEDGSGLYSQIFLGAGRRGEQTGDKINAPKEAIEALFGPEPAAGYPAEVISMISKIHERNDALAYAYLQTKDMGTPVTCKTTYTQVSETGPDSVHGILEQSCENVDALMNTPADAFDWKQELDVKLSQITDDSGDQIWVIADSTDGPSVE